MRMGMIYGVGHLGKFFYKDYMKQLFKEYWIILLIISLIMLMPIAVYIWRFGIIISNQHLRWAEMGSAMSGIYAPILSLLTLVVLGY